MKNILIPFEKIGKNKKLIIISSYIIIMLATWINYGYNTVHLFPTLPQVTEGLSKLWSEGLITHIFASLSLCFKAIGLSVIISLIFSYLYVIPIIKPVTTLISKLRYLPLTGITFYITLFVDEGRLIQVWVLVTFMTTFLITSLIAMINNIDESEFDHARSLGCSRFQILWEVVIKGRLDYVIEIVRQNLAIVWMFLVTIESIMVSTGGIGFLIKNSDKTASHGRIIALQIIILLIGIGLDYLLLKIRKNGFRYSKF